MNEPRDPIPFSAVLRARELERQRAPRTFNTLRDYIDDVWKHREPPPQTSANRGYDQLKR